MIRIVTSIALPLAVTVPAWAAEPHVGRWAIDPQACVIGGDTARTAPLTVTPTTLKWLVSCTVGKMYKAGTTLYIEARCSKEGGRRSVPVALETRGERLAVTWDGVRVEMQRCR